MRRVALIALTLSVFGCAGQSLVRGPTVPSSPISTKANSNAPKAPVIPSGNGNLPAAVLDATLLATRLPPTPDRASYDLRLLVTESTGKNAAIVQAIVVKMPNGNTDMGCVPLNIRVAPGDTVDLIREAGYCAPGVSGYYPGLNLSVDITYFDEAGGSKTLTVVTPLS